MLRPRPGWLVVASAAVLAISVWLPWVTTSAHGGGRANAAGGTVGSLSLPDRFGAGQLIVLLTSTLAVAGAMVAQRIATRWACAAALVISLGIVGLTAWYHHRYVTDAVTVSYGWYVGAAAGVAATACSLWAVIDAVLGGGEGLR